MRGRLLALVLTAVMLGACSSTGTSPSPSSSATTTPTSFPQQPACTETAIKSALPASAERIEFMTCAPLPIGYWAAATVSPGPTVYFLQAEGDRWRTEDRDQVCGQQMDGLTEQILDYCVGS